MKNVELVTWKDEYHPDFIALSVAWLEKYDLLEPADWEILNDPFSVRENGGEIFFARRAGRTVGTVAAVNNGGGSFEIAKLCVAENHQRRGIGEALLRRAVDYIRSCGAGEAMLYSNHKLTAALRLYHKVGFTEAVHENSKYEVSDIKMVMKLT